MVKLAHLTATVNAAVNIILALILLVLIWWPFLVEARRRWTDLFACTESLKRVERALRLIKKNRETGLTKAECDEFDELWAHIEKRERELGLTPKEPNGVQP